MEKAKTAPAEPGTVLKGFRAKILKHTWGGSVCLCIGGEGYHQDSFLAHLCDEETLSRFPVGTVFDLVVSEKRAKP
jgi:hypothetical protein